MSDMTISQAIRLVSKLKGQLAELQARGISCVTYLEKEEPAFKFSDTVAKMDEVSAQLVDLQSRVAAAGALTVVQWDGAPVRLGKAVRTAQELRSRIAWLKTLSVRAQAKVATQSTEYDMELEKHVRREVFWMCDLPEAKRADLVQSLQDKFDELNGLIETVNHATIIPA